MIDVTQSARDAAKNLLDVLKIHEHTTGTFRNWDATVQAIAAAEQRGMIAARDADEYGWLIEHEAEPKWLTLRPGEAAYEVCWTTESTDALRFARRSDADDYASTFLDEGPVRITDHIWSAPPAIATMPMPAGGSDA